MDMLSTAISLASFILSIIAFVFSSMAKKRANLLAGKNLDLQFGMIELEVRKSVENASANISSLAVQMAPLVSREKTRTITEEDSHTLAGLRKILDAYIQSMLNSYESACGKYLDGKIDKLRFRKEYKDELRNLFKNEHFKKHLAPPDSKYYAIIKVYNEWENLEK